MTSIRIAFFLTFVLLPGVCRGQGIVSLFTDPRPSKVGDIVTILISEGSQAAQTAQTNTLKDSQIVDSLDAQTTGGQTPTAHFNTKGKAVSNGGGSTTRSITFTAKVSATVVEVLPNGNLRLAAKQSVVVNHDSQMIEVHGIVRPADISNDNMVSSSALAEADIKYKGTGVLSRKQRRGLLNFLLGWIF